MLTKQICLILLFLVAAIVPASAVTFGISKDGKFFTIDDKPVFLNGISYYSATSIGNSDSVKKDLDDMVADGFNWIRVWTSWSTTTKENAAIFTPDGEIREPYMTRLKTLITECNKRKMIVDVSMSRGKTISPSDQAQHLACARTLATALLPYRNVYIDIGNERDVRDARFVSYQDMGELITTIKAIDPKRICTASGVPSDQDDLNKYLTTGKCDFVCPHLCRDKECPAKTLGTVKELITWMNNLGKRVPIHLQEPFRRDYAPYQPVQDDFYRDATGGKVGGAAGWCLHNGSNHSDPPYRSFDLNDKYGRLYAQLDSVEKDIGNNIIDELGGTSVKVIRYQAEYPEQLSHQTGRRDEYTWAADASKDSAGYLSDGPNTIISSGKYQVTWKLMIDNSTEDNKPVATLDIYSDGKVIAKKTITRKDFNCANTWKSFDLDFTSNGKQNIQFRTYWSTNSNIKLDHITLTEVN